jgi:hypothetical protein
MNELAYSFDFIEKMKSNSSSVNDIVKLVELIATKELYQTFDLKINKKDNFNKKIKI